MFILIYGHESRKTPEDFVGFWRQSSCCGRAVTHMAAVCSKPKPPHCAPQGPATIPSLSWLQLHSICYCITTGDPNVAQESPAQVADAYANT